MEKLCTKWVDTPPTTTTTTTATNTNVTDTVYRKHSYLIYDTYFISPVTDCVSRFIDK